MLLFRRSSEFCIQMWVELIQTNLTHTHMSQLTRSQQRVRENPLALLRSSKDDSPAKVKAAHAFWVERETRRRVLQACFILDTHQSALFEQPPVIGRRTPPRLVTQDNELPFPCDSDLWDTSSVEQWVRKARKYVAESLPAAVDKAISQPAFKVYNTFQSNLMLSHLITDLTTSPNDLSTVNALGRHLYRIPDAHFSYHAIFCARNTPIRNLLAVSGESWRFCKKLENEADFRDAKGKLRQWIESGDTPKRAVWHATQLLRLVFGSATQPSSTDLSMLHKQWSLYLACLICWAWGFDSAMASSRRPSGHALSSSVASRIISPVSEGHPGSSSSSVAGVGAAHPPLLDPMDAEADMYDYLDAMNVDHWRDVGHASVGSAGRFQGLLETVRTRKLMANLGELLNEGERVLYRLVEGRSALSQF